MRKNSLVETFSRAYAAASPEEQAALRVWMRDIVLPQKKRRKDLAKSRRCEKESSPHVTGVSLSFHFR